jgi:molybdopterin synthase catalytic subunit
MGETSVSPYDDGAMTTVVPCQPPSTGDSWLELTEATLPVGMVHDWCVLPFCGAVVLFSGTVRDHAEHRTGVTLLEYEAYESQVVPKLAVIEADIRRRFDEIGRVALLHRIGPLGLGEVSVIVAVSSAHRPAAFEAARFGIDALKATVPIWKRETWEGGTDWGLAATGITDVAGITDPSGLDRREASA